MTKSRAFDIDLPSGARVKVAAELGVAENLHARIITWGRKFVTLKAETETAMILRITTQQAQNHLELLY